MRSMRGLTQKLIFTKRASTSIIVIPRRGDAYMSSHDESPESNPDNGRPEIASLLVNML